MIQNFQQTTMASIGLLVLAQAYTVCCGDCVPANLQQQHRALQREGCIAARHPSPPPLRPSPCQQTHTAYSLSRPGSPCRTMSIDLHSKVIQHPNLLPTRCPQPIALSHACHLICKCITSQIL